MYNNKHGTLPVYTNAYQCIYNGYQIDDRACWKLIFMPRAIYLQFKTVMPATIYFERHCVTY